MGSCIQTEADIETLSDVAVSSTFVCCTCCFSWHIASLSVHLFKFLFEWARVFWILPAINLHLQIIIMFNECSLQGPFFFPIHFSLIGAFKFLFQGVTAVLNFQSGIEAENWGINSTSINESCQRSNILLINYPIR